MARLAGVMRHFRALCSRIYADPGDTKDNWECCGELELPT
jgi:hypothetical protein